MNKCQEIKVSVVIPVYNAAKWIDACLDSVCMQTLREIEIICVDDGAEDESLSLLQSYSKKDYRIFILNQENKGAGGARNHGLDNACGKYVSFLDVDDVFSSDMLEKTYERCERYEADICLFRYGLVDSCGTCFGEFGLEPELFLCVEYFKAEDIKKDLFGVTNPAAWNKLFRREFLLEEKIRFQEIPSINDMFFTYKSLLTANRITVVGDVLVYYREWNASAVSNSYNKSWYGLHTVLSAIKVEVENYASRFEKDFFNLAVRQLLYMPNTLNDREAYYSCIGKIRREWAQELLGNYSDESMYYEHETYERFQALMEGDIDDYCFFEKRRNEKHRNDLWYSFLQKDAELKKMKAEHENLAEKYYEISSLKNHIKQFFKKKTRTR